MGIFDKKWIKEAMVVLAVVGVVLGIIPACGQQGLGEAQTDEQASDTIQGLCYSPFRDGDNPNYGLFPLRQEIEEDLLLLSERTSKIRTYGIDDVLYEIPGLCDNIALNCYPGAWISGNAAANELATSALIEIGNQGWKTTRGLIVGSEVLLRGDLPVDELIGHVDRVRAETSLPVTVAETYWVYLNYPDLANAVDFILIHVHPYWDGVSIDLAAQYVLDQWEVVSLAYPDKEVIIGETGWPTGGEALGDAIPGEDNQKRFVEEFKQLAETNSVQYFFFAATDEAWKQEENDVGQHWGLYYANRSPKPAATDVLGWSDDFQTVYGQSPLDADSASGGGGCFISSATLGGNRFFRTGSRLR